MNSFHRHASEGFMFSHDLSRVVLIHKGRPDHLVGHLVGVGGKSEDGETAHDAMVREFREETGVHHDHWTHVLSFAGDLGQPIDVFRAVGDVDAVRTVTDEKIEIFSVASLPPEVYRTTKWAIPMCLDKRLLDGKRFISFPTQVVLNV
jgi:8-oxo-dGTP pyrophosphatase MutT (NUDIX family)